VKTATEACVDCEVRREAEVKRFNINELFGRQLADTFMKVMATQYQDKECKTVQPRAVLCPGDPLEGTEGEGGKGVPRKIVNLPAFLNSQYYSKLVTGGEPKYCSQNGLCTEACETPPKFNIGGRSSYDKNSNTLDVNGHKEGKVTGMDCAGQIWAVYQAAGLRVKSSPANDDFKEINRLWGTEKMANVGSAVDDCLEPAKFEGSISLLKGDTIVWPGNPHGHAAMVTNVGADPFGIEATLKSIPGEHTAAICNDNRFVSNLKTENLDFEMGMSANFGGKGMGVFRTRARDYFPNDPRFGGWIVKTAVKACEAKFDQALKPVSSVITNGKKKEFAIIRHKSVSRGSANSQNCMLPKKPKIKCEMPCPKD
jgi:hypothetical protein